MNFPEDSPDILHNMIENLLELLDELGLDLDVRRLGSSLPKLHITSRDGMPVESEKGGPLTPEILSLLKRHKNPLIQAVMRRQENTPVPPEPSEREKEFMDLDRRVMEEGYVLLYSKELDDCLAFHRDDFDPQNLPDGFVPYSDSEMKRLFGVSENEPHHLESLKLIHDTKRLFVGSRIIGNDKGTQ